MPAAAAVRGTLEVLASSPLPSKLWPACCPPPMQVETMYDATCLKIRETAERSQLAVPESLRPTAVPGPKCMYHINLSGEKEGSQMRAPT